jgi:beta-phosphoglucomutase
MDNAKGILFDMDGVLIDSYHAHFESWRRLAGEHDRTYTESQFAAGFGRTSREVIIDQWGGETLSDERIRQLDERKETIFREIVTRDFPAMDGAAELIRDAVDAGFRIAIGSSGPTENVRLAISRLGVQDRLRAIVTGSDVKRGKPDPQVFQLAAERIEVQPERCIVVEDAPVGIEAAHRSGMRCVGLASTGRTVAQLARADIVVKSLRELSAQMFDELLQKERQP